MLLNVNVKFVTFNFIMLKRVSILSFFLCAYTMFMLHNLMPHQHSHEHATNHTHHGKHDHHHSDKQHDSDKSLIDHSEAFGVAIVKSDDGLITKNHEQSPQADFIISSQSSDVVFFEHPPDKYNTYKHSLLYSNSFKSPKSLRAPPAYFLL